MRKHAEPGEGLLSKEAHKKLENFFFGEYNTFSILSLAVVYLSAFIFDDGLSLYYFSFFKEPLAANSVDIIAFLILSAVLLLAGTVVSLQFVQTKSKKLLSVISYILIPTIILLISFQYFIAVTYLEVPTEIIVLIGSYHLFSGIIIFRVAMTDSRYLESRIHIDSNIPTLYLIAVAILSIASHALFIWILGSEQYSWAFVVTFNLAFWAIFGRSLQLK